MALLGGPPAPKTARAALDAVRVALVAAPVALWARGDVPAAVAAWAVAAAVVAATAFRRPARPARRGPRPAAGGRPVGGPGAYLPPGAKRHLAALGLPAMPRDAAALDRAWKARMRVVHPDVGSAPSHEAAAAANAARDALARMLPG